MTSEHQPAGQAPVAPGEDAPAPRPARPRMVWMDTVRGAAILLMLLWHATSLPRLEGVEVPSAVVAFNDALLPYRMPTLMFLSGLLLPMSLRKPLGVYYRGKFALIAWPYVVWVLVLGLVDGFDLPVWHPRTFWPSTYLWFLFFICVYYLVAPLLRRLPPLVPPLAFWAAAMVVTSPLLHRMLYFAVFFFAGAWVAARIGDLPARLTNRPALVVCGLAALGFAVAAATHDITYVAATVPFSLCGIVVVVYLAARLGGARGTGPIRFVGRSSIVYYAAHFPVMLVVVRWTRDAGAPWWATIGTAYLAGLVVGTALAFAKGRAPVRWLFEMPFVAPARRANRVVPTAPPAPEQVVEAVGSGRGTSER
ncbi:MAG: acyltransferase [Cellulomonas sp.]|uniref:Acyltransferase 3 domain-containing protein n=1 Tax=Cellulomonas gelida TaxID=1712 RepID=A0A4Y3KSK6_9CELL|nr:MULTISPECIES: acyltransferase [Cellulomonas]MCR6649864.1 acyltransferase [Cellulomonas sp.]MCR6705755.1 acyltransferase [Cellulomonas sp.]GEA85838.1 hypothetical protein CGE01nite_30890 [Cellulomonas gelida]GGL15154.1 hypothetical protein GCM10009774_02200 [Cellulomonas gelida]